MNVENRTIFEADNLDILRGLDSETIDLIYLDPPFNSNRTYEAPIGSQAAGAAFKDAWTLSDLDNAWHGELAEHEPALYAAISAAEFSHSKSMKAYLIMMGIRVLEMWRILKPTGSIYLHCDPTASHYLKMVMDSVFGANNFRNEVIWKRTSTKSLAKRYAVNTDRILYYIKSDGATWNQQYAPYDDEYIQKTFRGRDQHGKYGTVDLSGGKAGSRRAYMRLKGIEPPPGRAWAPPTRNKFPDSAQVLLPDNYETLDALAKCEALDDAGLLHWPKGKIGRPRWKKYLSAMPGVVAGDLILDTPPVKGKERTGYPTQKPLDLLKHIIKASSNPNDIVLDPFCGCATTCIAAEALQRQWIGIDLSLKAVELVKIRLDSELSITEQTGLLGDKVIHRTDIPIPLSPADPRQIHYDTLFGVKDKSMLETLSQRELRRFKTHKHVLFGMQEGKCAGCQVSFHFRNMTIDHIKPRSEGGTDHITNLQLLCGACNSTKGNRTQAYLIDKLRTDGILR